MSGRIFVISDTHFKHENVAKWRGFESAQEQDELIVKNWNNIVTKGDVVYHLGDITMEKKDYSILDELKGFKKCALGNHDMPNHVRDLLEHVNSVFRS